MRPGSEDPLVARFRGCLLGGAVGDALGAPVEFMSHAEIRSQYGSAGVTDMVDGVWPAGSITDDTQMTLFTAEGLLRAWVRGALKGIADPPGVVDHAYARWLHTQGERSPRWEKWNQDGYDGWLVDLSPLQARRAPGNTCLSALGSDRMGTLRRPLNHSKGCGGVMRVAPVGLLAERKLAFSLGVEIGAITHGHPSGYLSAGFLAAVIAAIRDGLSFEAALEDITAELKRHPGHEETLSAVGAARELAAAGTPSAEEVQRLGGGWVGEEALAIALYAVLATDSFRDATLLAINHGGDSDSTGAIAGNLAGVVYGERAIPDEWLERLELREAITRIAEDLYRCWRQTGWDPKQEWEQYPGW